MTLVEFLNARITEDEAAAYKALRSYQHVFGIPHYFDPRPGREFPSSMVAMNPKVALAECEAKWRIIMIWEEQPSVFAEVLATVAEVYADHPDYDPEWRA